VDRVTAVIVNYGTPDLTRAAAWSLRSHYPALPVLLVDNASPDDSRVRLEALVEELGAASLLTPGANLHHGPGLDVAIRQATTDWVLTVDSDCVLYRGGVLERMLDTARAQDAYMVGRLHRVDDDGFDGGPHPYVHPKFALVDRAAYATLPPFEKHGAPCLANERAAAQRGLALADFPVSDWVLHLGEGTVRRYGYGLGIRSRLSRLKRLLRR